MLSFDIGDFPMYTSVVCVRRDFLEGLKRLLSGV
jgi:hypothetical protein